jgi:LysR substrate binding domain
VRPAPAAKCLRSETSQRLSFPLSAAGIYWTWVRVTKRWLRVARTIRKESRFNRPVKSGADEGSKQDLASTIESHHHRINLPFILFETGFALNRIILDACRRHGFEPALAAQSSQIDFIVELAAAGLGIGFLPRMIADQRKHSSVKRIPLSEPNTDWNIAMIWRRGGFLSHAAKAWLDLVQNPRAKK